MNPNQDQENVEFQEVKAEEKQPEQISIDVGTAFALALQEFDKKIAEAEFVVYDLKKQRAAYIYDQNVKQIVETHREKLIKAQIEEEAKRKLAESKN